MLEDFLSDKVNRIDIIRTNPVTRNKSDDWTLWAIAIAFGGIMAVLIMGFALFGIVYLAGA